MTTEVILLNGKPVKEVMTSLYSGFVENTDIKITNLEKPLFKWRGAKIPFDLWSQVVSFLRWTQEEFKSEALVTFFYNTKTNTWAAWPFPQETAGMTVKHLEDKPLYKEDRAMFKKDWIQAGSVHHHCTAGAFASNTDEQDECNRDGVHITLGKMDQAQLDFHVRQVFEGVVTNCTLSDWIDEPSWCKTIPNPLRLDVAHWSRTCIRQTKFPDEWKSRVSKPSFPVPTIPHTILGSVSNPNIKRDRRPVTGSDVTTWQNKWKDDQAKKLMEVCSQLGISASEVKALMSDYPDPTWDQLDTELRNTLSQELLKQGFPLLYLDDIVESII